MTLDVARHAPTNNFGERILAVHVRSLLNGGDFLDAAAQRAIPSSSVVQPSGVFQADDQALRHGLICIIPASQIVPIFQDESDDYEICLL